MDSTTTSGQSWGDWLQGIGSTIIKGYADAKVYLPAQIRTLEIQKLGQDGYYTEGQRGGAPAATIAGVPTSLLLIGGLVVAVMLLKA